MKKFRFRQTDYPLQESAEHFATLENLISGIDFSGEEEPWNLFPEIAPICAEKKQRHRKNNKMSTAPQHCHMKKSRRNREISRLSDQMKSNLVLKESVSDLLNMAEYAPQNTSTSYQQTYAEQANQDYAASCSSSLPEFLKVQNHRQDAENYAASCSNLWDDCGDVGDLEQYLSPEFLKVSDHEMECEIPKLFSEDGGNWKQYLLFS